MFFLLINKFKFKINLKDRKLLFLIFINLIPILLMFLTSMLTGSKIRTMWMTPFYLFMGVLLVYIFQKNIFLNKLKYFFSIFLILFIILFICVFLMASICIKIYSKSVNKHDAKEIIIDEFLGIYLIIIFSYPIYQAIQATFLV